MLLRLSIVCSLAILCLAFSDGNVDATTATTAITDSTTTAVFETTTPVQTTTTTNVQTTSAETTTAETTTVQITTAETTTTTTNPPPPTTTTTTILTTTTTTQPPSTTPSKPSIGFDYLDCSDPKNNGVKSFDNGYGVFKQCVGTQMKFGCYWKEPRVPVDHILDGEIINYPYDTENVDHLTYDYKCRIVPLQNKPFAAYDPIQCIVKEKGQPEVKIPVGGSQLFDHNIAPLNGNFCRCNTFAKDPDPERSRREAIITCTSL